ncbi:c-type cytochrome [Caenispirillum bisanense]|uniref:c-type cytochrome n=1 Tax=Caenispirillum bisanense TaxID=414052 RepID=UPI0031D1782F
MSRITTVGAAALFAAATAAATLGLSTTALPAFAAEPAAWTVPDVDSLPNDVYGDFVRRGRTLFTETYAHIGPEVADPEKRFAGNNLACGSCHLEAGTQKFGIPMIGVYADFPQYRGRENTVGTIEGRINGCMQRSMNGKSLPHTSPEMRAMVAYIAFMSRGIPVGAKVEGRQTPVFNPPERAADPAAGAAVYAEHCAACHGDDGLGVRRGEPGDAKGYEYPPLWGPDTYNHGAGMHRVLTAAAFIQANMPLGTTHEAPLLTDDEAYDVAAYINSHQRPIREGVEKDYPDLSKKPVDSPYAPYYDDFPAEQHKYGPFQPLMKAQKEKAAAAKAATTN